MRTVPARLPLASRSPPAQPLCRREFPLCRDPCRPVPLLLARGSVFRHQPATGRARIRIAVASSPRRAASRSSGNALVRLRLDRVHNSGTASARQLECRVFLSCGYNTKAAWVCQAFIFHGSEVAHYPYFAPAPSPHSLSMGVIFVAREALFAESAVETVPRAGINSAFATNGSHNLFSADPHFVVDAERKRLKVNA